MALFKRKDTTTNKLPELEWYNESERRGRRVRTWVLAVGALLAAGLLVLGLFFGGRWAYRQITKDDAPATTQTEDTPQTADNTERSTDDETLKSINSSPTHVDQNVGTDNQTLANTGPSGIVYVFVVTSVLGTVYYRVRLQSKQAR